MHLNMMKKLMHLNMMKTKLLSSRVINRGIAAAFALLATSIGLSAELALPAIFSDHMVLQREQAVPVWGTADAGATLTVQFAGQSKSATADSAGKWRIDLEPLQASATPRELLVTSSVE